MTAREALAIVLRREHLRSTAPIALVVGIVLWRASGRRPAGRPP